MEGLVGSGISPPKIKGDINKKKIGVGAILSPGAVSSVF